MRQFFLQHNLTAIRRLADDVRQRCAEMLPHTVQQHPCMPLTHAQLQTEFPIDTALSPRPSSGISTAADSPFPTAS